MCEVKRESEDCKKKQWRRSVHGTDNDNDDDDDGRSNWGFGGMIEGGFGRGEIAMSVSFLGF